jgi:hypothetical protein
LRDLIFKNMQNDVESNTTKKPSSEYRFPIKPSPLVSNMKQGPKTQNGSQHENANIDNMENEVDSQRGEEMVPISRYKTNLTGDIEDVGKEGFSSKVAATSGNPNELRLQR